MSPDTPHRTSILRALAAHESARGCSTGVGWCVRVVAGSRHGDDCGSGAAMPGVFNASIRDVSKFAYSRC